MYTYMLVLHSGAFYLYTYSMTCCVYSVAHTMTEPIRLLAQHYGFNMYTQRINAYVYLWCLVMDLDSVGSTHIQLLYSDYLTYMYDA
jgi:hypothetical protein